MKLFNNNIRTIFLKELKDILRDRRTLFVAIILPIIINPLLIIGLLFVFSSQTEKEMQKSFTATIIGKEQAPELTKIIHDYDPNPMKPAPKTDDEEKNPEQKGIVKLVEIDAETEEEKKELAIKRLEVEGDERIDVVVVFPDRFEERLQNQETLLEPEIYFLGTSDRSTTARQHITNIMNNFVKRYEPIKLKSTNVREGSLAVKEIAKIIPYILILMILTAAFTPAIDLMAGEKERGTIETLLITPADRREIVLGKFYTVFTVAIAATVLNLASLGATVAVAKNILQSSVKAAVAAEKASMEKTSDAENSDVEESVNPEATTADNNGNTQSQPPSEEIKAAQEKQKQLDQAMTGGIKFPSMPIILFPVLLLMMIPAAALFGAIALALSSYAKSYKEGQYYITPMMMVAIPLSMVSLLPGIKFNFWLGITPITNLSLIFRDIMTNITVNGSGGVASLNWGNILIVLVSTTIYALLALKWARDIFYREDVLFREAEELNWKFWKVAGPPKDAPSVGAGILAFIISFILFMYIGQLWQTEAIAKGTNAFIRAMIQSQVLLIALPAVIMFRMNKYKLSKVFPVKRISILSFIAILLMMPALSLLMLELMKILQVLGMEVNQDAGLLQEVMGEMNILTAVLIIAVLPGICEDILFRGFIFSAFRNSLRGTETARAWKAIIFSAILFGIMHFTPIRIPITFIGGVVLAFVMWRTNNLLAAMLAHMIYNASSMIIPDMIVKHTVIWNVGVDHIPVWLAIISFALLVAGIVLLARRKIPENDGDSETPLVESSDKVELMPKPESEE